MNKLTIPDSLAKDVATRLGCKTDAAVDFIEIALQNALLFDQKQLDYGPRNMCAFGPFGVIVRANDKFERLKHIFNNRRFKAINESIEDSFRDISNYCIIATMLEHGRWPEYDKPSEEMIRVRETLTNPSNMKKYLVIHHDADYDGLLSNEVCRHFLSHGDNVVQSIGWDYGKPVPEVDAFNWDSIFLVDISIPELMDQQKLPNLIWIDHHKTAIDQFDSTIPGYRIDGVAACRLVWQWFLGDKNKLPTTKEHYIDRTVDEPLLIRLAGEHDIWDHRDERALILQSGLRELEPEEFASLVRAQLNNEQLANQILDDCIKLGVRAKQSRDRANASTITKIGHDVYWHGITFLCCNGLSGSQAFAAGIKPHHKALMAWRYDGQQKKATVSLYHAPEHEEIDLSVLAKAEGGGGHKGACGFQCSLDNLFFILKDIQ